MGWESAIGDVFGAVTNTIDAGTGGWWSDQTTKKSTKRNYKYNSWLQSQNQEFQKYMAENAHQMEVQDLINAGLNPALSSTGSSAGSIASSSSAQGTSPGSAVGGLANIVDSINAIRKTNAEIDNINAQTGAIKRGNKLQDWFGEDADAIKQIIKEKIKEYNNANETFSEKAERKSKEAEEDKNKNYSKEEKYYTDKFDNFWKR